MKRNIQNFVTNNEHEMVYVSVGHTLILSWTNSHYWLRDHTSWALMELEWRLKVFPNAYNLCFEIHHTKVHSLVLIFWNLQVHVIYFEWSRSVIFSAAHMHISISSTIIHGECGLSEQPKEVSFPQFCLWKVIWKFGWALCSSHHFPSLQKMSSYFCAHGGSPHHTWKT